jgi:uncharacterized protein (TIGR03083 family)
MPHAYQESQENCGGTLSIMSPPADPPHDYIVLFQAERARLSLLLTSLSPGDWPQPTPCPGWSVLDLACHLLGDDLSTLARHRDGHFGTEPPPGMTDEAFPAWLDTIQGDWVRAARRISPRTLIDLLAWTGPQVAEAFRRQDPAARSASVSWAARDLVPAWLGHARELSEHWIHRQQVLQALGRPGDLDPELATPVLDALRWAWPYRLSARRADPATGLIIEVTGEVARTWHLVATTEGWEFRDDPGSPIAAAITLTTDQAWRLLTSNLPAAAVPGLAATGDKALIDALLNTRAIIGTPKWA